MRSNLNALEIIKRPFIILWKTYFFIWFLISLFIVYPIFLFLFGKKKRFRTAFKLKKIWSWFLSLITGVVLIRKGKNNFPDPPYVLVSNHSSYFDIILMYPLVPHYFTIIGKAEIQNWPLFNIFFTKGMNIPVDRRSIKDAHKAYQRAGDELEKGNSMVLFPEGTIPVHVPRMRKFKNGAFKLAIEKQVPIVPVTFTHNYKRLENGGFLKAPASPGLAPAIVHPPVETKGLNEKDIVSLRDKVFDIINSSIITNENK